MGRIAQMFLGSYLHNIDSKGRLTLPAKFRAELAKGVVVTLGLDGCLWVFPTETWEEIARKMNELPLTNKFSRHFARRMYGYASDCEPDKQGRILLPPSLRERAGLDGETVVVGGPGRLEIWSRESWERTTEEIEKNGDAIAEQLFELGLL
ncbi:MAG TPA: division/cell wall cluster transcriptional repressor MraZ [Anaerolineae bacterium]|nr:division/cell wall cluster transcriptional repressor MraZ [Anaerolineae bacterium]